MFDSQSRASNGCISQMQYELQFLKVEIEHTSVIHRAIRSKTSREYRRKVYDTPRHDEIKKRQSENIMQLRQYVFGAPQHNELKKRKRERKYVTIKAACVWYTTT